MRKNGTHRLVSLRRRYLLVRLLEVLCAGGAAGITAFALSNWAKPGSSDAWVLAILVGLVVFLWQFYHSRLHQLSLARMASLVNALRPEMQWSTDLLTAPSSGLSRLQLLQQERAGQTLGEISRLQFPHHMLRNLMLLGGALLLLSAISIFQKEKKASGPGSLERAGGFPPAETIQAGPATLEGIAVTIKPPAYTGLHTISVGEPSIKAVEGSVVSWSLSFSGPAGPAFLVFSGRDTLELELAQNNYTGSRSLFRSSFYQVLWTTDDGIRSSDFYQVEIAPDLEPKISMQGTPQFRELQWNDDLRIPLTADIRDDYGLTDGNIVATVTKGSGESVKFREEVLRFDSSSQVSGKHVAAQKLIDLRKLGLEPGDELYFYVQAWDNKQPEPLHARTETFFVQIKDTASYITSADGGLGVDLMPEYFRSQRQIIIDSEKLVAERGKVSKQEFDGRSNGLAHDQKVLRLRYGQFLGEEFESGMMHNDAPEEDHHEHGGEEETDVLKEYGHAHDTHNEHNLVPEHRHTESADPEKKENPLEAFAHMHDSEEEATFFIQSVKSKLRAALSLMWDAELHLRMNSPEQSLPYQYQILKLLKEISNDSRIYVHRTGFDPPPIKEDKRLTGDLSEVDPSRSQYHLESGESHPGIRKALPLLERMARDKQVTLTEADREVLSKAGNEMAAAALEEPGAYLESMSRLKKLLDGDLPEPERASGIRLIMRSFWRILPQDASKVSAAASGLHASDRQLLDQLEKISNE